MTTEKPEEAMTFGELLALISEQQRRLVALEHAFTGVTAALDSDAHQALLQQLQRAAQNQDHDALLRQQFSRLATVIEKQAGRDASPQT
ncbi:hypothetical protein [[Erwinia] mediterraneensis]|uniref:hypothetical protein n=1 Tax=[Erwinia] mediterraneensis TaxID=2161819 RepID=UPI0010306C1A|nr:hypothetical protein [[Erwinia] mediterraneensis]